MQQIKEKTNSTWLSSALVFLVKISGYIALSAVAGVLGGKWLDAYFGTAPVVTILLIATGFGLSIAGILREIKSYTASL